MKKTLLVALASSLLMAPGAFAQSFEDLPSDHWAAQAVQKLVDKGVMTGFPDKTFQGKRNVSRYELAATLNKLLEKIESIDVSKQTQEVKDTVAAMKKDLGAEMAKMKESSDKMREDMKKDGDAMLDKVMKSLSKVKFDGVMKVGTYVENISNIKDKAGADVSEMALRPNFVAKLNIKAPVVEDKLSAGLQLSTGADPYSSANMMGTDGWAKKAFGLNRAYLTWTPNQNWEIGMGKFDSPFHEYESTLDADVGYEGIYVKPQFGLFTATLGAFPIKLDDKQGWLALDKSQFLAAGQLGFNFNWLNLNLGVFSYQNIDATYAKGVNGDSMTLDKDGKPLFGYNVANLGLDFNFKVGVPVAIKINALKNLGKFDNFEFGLPTSGFQKDDAGKTKVDDKGNGVPNSGNTMGLVGGLAIGNVKENRFQLGFDYGMLGSDATIGVFNASPARIGTNSADVKYTNLGTNVTYMKPYLSIGLAENVTLDAFAYMANKLGDNKKTDTTSENPSILSSYLGIGTKF